MYSNIGGGVHVRLGLLLDNIECVLILDTPFVYPNHPDTLIVPDGMTSHINSNMRIAHTEEVRLFREVMVLQQALIKYIFSIVKEAYLADIHN